MKNALTTILCILCAMVLAAGAGSVLLLRKRRDT